MSEGVGKGGAGDGAGGAGANGTVRLRLSDDSADAALTCAGITAGNITASGYVSVGSAEVLAWSSRSKLNSPADGQVNILVAAETAGVGLDFATDAVLKVRTRAQTGYATVDALAYNASGTKVLGAQGAAVADASGGAVIDAEARTALNALLARMRTHGAIAT